MTICCYINLFPCLKNLIWLLYALKYAYGNPRKEYMNKVNKKLLSLVSLGFVLAFVGSKEVFAGCTPVYGGGEICEYNNSFKITKEVRVKGDSDWKDKVTDVKKDDVVEFRIEVKNRSDEETDSADRMKMEDFLPKEMERVGGDDLTEKWDDFEPGDTKKFTIEAKVKSGEYDREDKFDKCVVNKAELRWDGAFQGSDTATVCYGDITPTELPKTGILSALGLSGLGMLAVGIVSKKFKK